MSPHDDLMIKWDAFQKHLCEYVDEFLEDKHKFTFINYVVKFKVLLQVLPELDPNQKRDEVSQ